MKETLHNKFKLGVFDGLHVEPIRTKECEENLASCLGVTVQVLIRLGILKELRKIPTNYE